MGIQELSYAPFLNRYCNNRRYQYRAFLHLMLAGLITSVSPLTSADERREQAPALSPNVDLEGFKLQRKDFRFSVFTAWLKRDGTWHIEGTVQHNGLLCGTYEVGMRFGIGTPGCANVQWVSTDQYVTSQSQCNNTEFHHSGTNIDDSLTSSFDEITCGEAVTRCTGKCDGSKPQDNHQKFNNPGFNDQFNN